VQQAPFFRRGVVDPFSFFFFFEGGIHHETTTEGTKKKNNHPACDEHAFVSFFFINIYSNTWEFPPSGFTDITEQYKSLPFLFFSLWNNQRDTHKPSIASKKKEDRP
jgi:hypothetical protein